MEENERSKKKSRDEREISGFGGLATGKKEKKRTW